MDLVHGTRETETNYKKQWDQIDLKETANCKKKKICIFKVIHNSCCYYFVSDMFLSIV